MPRHHALTSLAAAALVATLLLSPASAAPLEATVLSWHDGDTLRVVVAGRTETVRLNGIDAPEASPNDRARDQARRLGIPLRELLDPGRRSRDFASRLAPPGTRVVAELDVQTRDRYGRLLAYLWLPDGAMLNERILEAGCAFLLTVPPNVRHVDRLREAQRRARERGAGLWASGSPGQERRAACDPSYPDVCIPLPRQTWTAGTSHTGVSGSCHRIPTGSTGTGTGSGASGEPSQVNPMQPGCQMRAQGQEPRAAASPGSLSWLVEGALRKVPDAARKPPCGSPELPTGNQPTPQRKAVLELVARRSFGPDRLRKYGI